MAEVLAGQDLGSIASLVIFCLTVAAVLVLVLFQPRIPIPFACYGKRCHDLWPRIITLELPKRRGPSRSASAEPFNDKRGPKQHLLLEPLYIPLPYYWAPVIGVAFMLIFRSIGWADLWQGLVGDDRICPYGIMVSTFLLSQQLP